MAVKLPWYKGCFGCGKLNPIGLKLEIFWDEEKREVFSEFCLDERYVGFEDVIHGGIVSTVADELLWWAVAASLHKCTVTAEMTIKYRKPLNPGVVYRGVARVVEVKGRKIIAFCEIVKDGVVFASASGLFVALPDEEWERFLEEIEDSSVFQK